MELLAQVTVGVVMVVGTVVGLVLFQRSLDKPGGRAGLGGIGDAFGNLVDVFDPGQARSAREIKRELDAGPVTRAPDDEDDDPLRLVTGPDGRPRAVRIHPRLQSRRTRGSPAED